MNPNRIRCHPHPALRHARGVSLIELMISLVLGLLVVGAAIGIFVANRQTFRATDSLGQIQENARTAFELMGRDLRGGGSNPCRNNIRVTGPGTNARIPGVPNTIYLRNYAGAGWFSPTHWNGTLRGYGNTDAIGGLATGTATGERVANTNALEIVSADSDVATVTAYNTGTKVFTLSTGATHDFAVNDVMLACNTFSASIFKVSAVNGSTITGAAAGKLNGDFSRVGSILTRLRAVRWYIGNNASGGRSLYQSRMGSNGAVTNEEIAEGVRDMQVSALLENLDGSLPNNYTPAPDVGATNWGRALAVRVQVMVAGQSTDGRSIERTMVQVASLRNRNE